MSFKVLSFLLVIVFLISPIKPDTNFPVDRSKGIFLSPQSQQSILQRAKNLLSQLESEKPEDLIKLEKILEFIPPAKPDQINKKVQNGILIGNTITLSPIVIKRDDLQALDSLLGHGLSLSDKRRGVRQKKDIPTLIAYRDELEKAVNIIISKLQKELSLEMLSRAIFLLALYREFFRFGETLLKKKIAQPGPQQKVTLGSPLKTQTSFSEQYISVVLDASHTAAKLSFFIAKAFADKLKNQRTAEPFYASAVYLSMQSDSMTNPDLIHAMLENLIWLAHPPIETLEKILFWETKGVQSPLYYIQGLIQRHDFQEANHYLEDYAKAFDGDIPEEQIILIEKTKGLILFEEGRELLFKDNNLEGAREKLLQAKKIFVPLSQKKDPDSITFLVQVLFHLGDFKDIDDTFSRHVDSEALVQPYAYAFVALANWKLGKTDHALKYLSKLGSTFPYFPETYLYMFQIFAMMDFPDLAFKAFEKGYALGNGDPQNFIRFFTLLHVSDKTKVALLENLLQSKLGDTAVKDLSSMLSWADPVEIYLQQAEPLLQALTDNPDVPVSAKKRARILLDKVRKKWVKKDPSTERAALPTTDESPTKKQGEATDSPPHWLMSALERDVDENLAILLAILQMKPKKQKSQRKVKSVTNTQHAKGANQIIAKVRKSQYLVETSKQQKAADYASIITSTFLSIGNLDWESSSTIVNFSDMIFKNNLLFFVKKSSRNAIQKTDIAHTDQENIPEAIEQVIHGSYAHIFWTAIGDSFRMLVNRFTYRGFYDEALKAGDEVLNQFESYLQSNPSLFEQGIQSVDILISFTNIAILLASTTNDTSKKDRYYQRAGALFERLELVIKKSEAAVETLVANPDWSQLIATTSSPFTPQTSKREQALQYYDEFKKMLHSMQFEYRYLKLKLLTQPGLATETDEASIRSLAINRDAQTTIAALTTAEALIALGEHQETADFLIAYLNDPTGVNVNKVEIYDYLAKSLKHTDNLSTAALLYFRSNLLIPGGLKDLFELTKTLLALALTESNKVDEILPLVMDRLLKNADPSNKKYPGTKEEPIPASLQVEQRPLREAHILQLFEQLAPGFLNLKNVRPDLLKALLVQILKGPEVLAQAFETALKTTEKADWKIIEVLDSIELKKPKAKKKGGKVLAERVLVDKAIERKGRWKDAIQNRFNIEEPKKRKGWIQDKFTGIQDPLIIEKIFEKIPSPLTHEEELFLSLAEEAFKEVATEVAPYLPEEERNRLLTKIKSGEASFLDLASAELAHFSSHWENISQDIPTFLSDAKKTRFKRKIQFI